MTNKGAQDDTFLVMLSVSETSAGSFFCHVEKKPVILSEAKKKRFVILNEMKKLPNQSTAFQEILRFAQDDS